MCSRGADAGSGPARRGPGNHRAPLLSLSFSEREARPYGRLCRRPLLPRGVVRKLAVKAGDRAPEHRAPAPLFSEDEDAMKTVEFVIRFSNGSEIVLPAGKFPELREAARKAALQLIRQEQMRRSRAGKKEHPKCTRN